MIAMRICLLSLVLSSAGCERLQGPDSHLSRTESLLNAGDYNTAAITAHNLVRKDPENGRARLVLARAYWLQGNLESSVTTLEAAAKVNADAAGVADLRARIALEQGQAEDLLVDLESNRSPLAASERLKLKALALLKLQRPVEALAIANDLVKSGVPAPDVMVIVAECHAMLGRREMAIDQAERALAADPKSSRAWALLSGLLQGDNPREARKALDRAIEYAPGQLGTLEQVALLTNAASSAISNQEVDSAAAAHAGLIRLAPQAPLTTLIGAQVRMLQGKNADAVAALQRLTPNFPAARPALIGALLVEGSYELAIHQVSLLDDPGWKGRLGALRSTVAQAAGAIPGSEDRAVKAAAAAMALEQPLAASEIVAEGLRAHPDSIPLSVAQQRLLLRFGQAPRALELARALASRAPDDRRVLAALAEAQAGSGEHTAAIASYELLWAQQRTGPLALALAQARLSGGARDPLQPLTQWLASNPQDTVVRMALAAAAQQIGQLDQAASEYERIVAQQPRNFVALNNLAWLYYKRNDPRALNTAGRAYDMAPGIPSIADTYGVLLSESGDVPSAIPILRLAVQGAPAIPEIRLHLGAALARGGSPDERAEARQLLEDLLLDVRLSGERTEAEKLLATLTRN